MTHGGKRPNTGQKLKYGTPLNRTIRVPESWVEPIKTALTLGKTHPFGDTRQFVDQTFASLRLYEHQLRVAKRSSDKHKHQLAFSIAERLIDDLRNQLKRLI
jgi:hypothetical protein